MREVEYCGKFSLMSRIHSTQSLFVSYSREGTPAQDEESDIQTLEGKGELQFFQNVHAHQVEACSLVHLIDCQHNLENTKLSRPRNLR